MIEIRDMKEVGRSVRSARRAQGVSQTTLARLSNVGLRFLCDVERGKASVHAGKLLAVLASLGIAVRLDIPEA